MSSCRRCVGPPFPHARAMNPPPLPLAALAGDTASRSVTVVPGGDDLATWYATDVPWMPPPTTTTSLGIFLRLIERAEDRASRAAMTDKVTTTKGADGIAFFGALPLPFPGELVG